MSQPARYSTLSWWERLLRRRPPAAPPARAVRRPRPTTASTASATRRGTRPNPQSPATLSLPVINIESATSQESSADESQARTILFPTVGHEHDQTGHSEAIFGTTDQKGFQWDCPMPGVSHVLALEAAPNSSFENANKVILRSDSTENRSIEDDLEEGEVVEQLTPATSYDQAYIANLKAQMADCETALKRVTAFSYESKQCKKISELTVDAEKLLHLWGEALEKKDVLADVIQECIEANSQSSDRLLGEVKELDLLYRELSEALANLRRTCDTQRAVRSDIRTMTKVVANASAKEHAEVGKVALVHENEAYSKWQLLRNSNDVPALEELRKELMDKQRAVAGLDALVRRRLRLSQSAPSEPEPGLDTPYCLSATDTGISVNTPAAASQRKTGKVGSHRVPSSPSRRSAGARGAGKRKLAEDARQERKAASSAARDLMVIRYQSQGGAGGSVASQAGGAAPTTVTAVTAGVTATTSSAPPPPPPPPLTLPAQIGPQRTPVVTTPTQPQMLRLTAIDADEDSGTADETSTSNDDEPTPEASAAEALVLAAAFPLHLSAAIFGSLDPTESAEIMHLP